MTDPKKHWIHENLACNFCGYEQGKGCDCEPEEGSVEVLVITEIRE